ncbi:MAG: hypothetical protein GXX79_12495 [Actinomycetales bacterium]|nr:hypothetical protein [Actinomycetales bacterium]
MARNGVSGPAPMARVLWFSCPGHGARAAADLLIRRRVRWVTDLAVRPVMIVIVVRAAVR